MSSENNASQKCIGKLQTPIFAGAVNGKPSPPAVALPPWTGLGHSQLLRRLRRRGIKSGLACFLAEGGFD
jgi:hypothetical protein